MLSTSTKVKIKRRILQFFYAPYILYNYLFLIPKERKRIKIRLLELINSKERGQVFSSTEKIEDNPTMVPISEFIFLGTSFRVTTEDRFDILKVSIMETLKNLKTGDQKIKFKVSDASGPEFSMKNKGFLEQFSNISLEYDNKKTRLNEAYYNMLTASSEKYFCMVFDDFPIINMTNAFIKAACALLDDFEGLVEMIYMECVGKIKIDIVNKKIYFDHRDRYSISKKSDIVGFVNYNGIRFALIKNIYYGFFFNTIIVKTKQYANKLKWYMSKVNYDSPHSIELAASLSIGPVYNFIAVPIDTVNFDIDYAHTDTSPRDHVRQAREVYDALSNGFNIESVGDFN